MTPEQGCIGCSISVGLLLVTFAFWAWVYWRYEPSFHPPGQTPPFPFSQPAKKGRGLPSPARADKRPGSP